MFWTALNQIGKEYVTNDNESLYCLKADSAADYFCGEDSYQE